MVCLSRVYPLKFFNGCFPQISLGPFLNTLSYVTFVDHEALTLLPPSRAKREN